MSALATYGASQLPTAMDIGVAVGKSLGSAAVATGKGMYEKRRARKNQRPKKYTKYRDALKDVGRKVGSDESRKNIRESGVTAIANKVMFDEPLILLEKNVAANEAINKRSRDTVRFRGTKICFFAKNMLRTPVFLNWAIVTPKSANFVDASDILRSGTAERDLVVNSAARFMDLKCAQINTDRYRVLDYQRHTILPDSDKGTTSTDEGRDLKIIEKYVPINKQVFFNGDTALPLTNVYMVWWCDHWNSGVGTITDTLEVSWRMMQYFNDIA